MKTKNFPEKVNRRRCMALDYLQQQGMKRKLSNRENREMETLVSRCVHDARAVRTKIRRGGTA